SAGEVEPLPADQRRLRVRPRARPRRPEVVIEPAVVAVAAARPQRDLAQPEPAPRQGPQSFRGGGHRQPRHSGVEGGHIARPLHGPIRARTELGGDSVVGSQDRVGDAVVVPFHTQCSASSIVTPAGTYAPPTCATYAADAPRVSAVVSRVERPFSMVYAPSCVAHTFGQAL